MHHVGGADTPINFEEDSVERFAQFAIEIGDRFSDLPLRD
jgi:hypothetical protein